MRELLGDGNAVQLNMLVVASYTFVFSQCLR